MTETSAASAVGVDSIVGRYREDIVAGMRAALARPGVGYAPYIRYHLGWEDAGGAPTDAAGGKLLRPALCLLCCEAAGGTAAAALPAAVAIELLHNFSLIHDDIEDKSRTRHGRATLWTIAGLEQALNAGDGLFALAQRMLLELESAGQPPERVVRAAVRFNDACIALCEGQRMDISFESRRDVTVAEYEAMTAGKTGALMAAAASIGALSAGATEADMVALGTFGLSLGLAFQMQDDVLGVWGNPDHTGKSSGDDIRARKKSFPVAYAQEHLPPGPREDLIRRYAQPPVGDGDVGAIVALIGQSGAREAALELARAHAARALDAINALELQPARRAELETLAAFVVARDR